MDAYHESKYVPTDKCSGSFKFLTIRLFFEIDSFVFVFEYTHTTFSAGWISKYETVISKDFKFIDTFKLLSTNAVKNCEESEILP